MKQNNMDELSKIFTNSSDGADHSLKDDSQRLPRRIAFHTKRLLEASPLIAQRINRVMKLSPQIIFVDSSIITDRANDHIMSIHKNFPKASFQLMKRLSEANMQRLRLEEPPTKERSEKLTLKPTYRNFWTKEIFLGSNRGHQLEIEICPLPDRMDQPCFRPSGHFGHFMSCKSGPRTN